MIGSANDYQLANGGKNETIFSRAHVTFDAGKTWTTVPINFNGYIATGDPAVAFDAAGNAYLATLGFGFGQGSPTRQERRHHGLVVDRRRQLVDDGDPRRERQRLLRQRRHLQRQGVHRRLGRRERDRHLVALQRPPEGRVRRLADLRVGHA